MSERTKSSERKSHSNQSGQWASSPHEAIAAVLAAARASGLLALDTEFVRDRTYFPELALVQLAARTDAGVVVAIIDPLAPDSPVDFEALAEVLLDEEVVKALHSAGQDFDVLRFVLGIVPEPLFDSQVAAAELDLGRQLSYAALVEQILGLTLEKGAQRADWLRRPLTPALLEYAAADVLHLVPLVEALGAKIMAAGKSAALHQRCQALVDGARREETPAQLADRVRGGSRLAGAELRRLRALAAWREREARAHNVPRRWLIEDEVIVALARTAPADTAQLSAMAEVPVHIPAKYGVELVDLLAAAG